MIRTYCATILPLTLAVLVWAPTPALAQESGGSETEDIPRFGGPNSVKNQIARDSEEKKPLFGFRFLKPYFAWKKGLQEKRGLSLGFDYSTAYLSASESLNEDTAASGMVRFFGAWDLVGRGKANSGSLVWKVEHRHRYTDIPPGSLGFDLGYVGLFEPPFSDQGLRWTNLYWRQRWKEGRIVLVGGFLDATDYVDVYGLASPWLHFNNFLFSTGAATIALPNDALLGVAAAGMLTDKMYLIGGLGDSNSDPTKPIDGFDTFFNDNEYFKHVEVGWTTSKDRIYFDNVHLTLWHVDDRQKAGVKDGWGAVFSFSHYVNDRWMPFFRAGYAEDGGTLLGTSVSAGIGYQPVPGRGLLGIGLNWGEPNEDTFVAGLDDQTTLELFYRLQLSEEIALTPDIQLLRNPALNPSEDTIWVIGLRARIAL